MPRFEKTFCSQCGGEFGPGDHGYSHCQNHRKDEPLEPDISLVKALWNFIEDSGSTEEFFELRARVRQHGNLYDSAPALITQLKHARALLLDAYSVFEPHRLASIDAAIAKAEGRA